MRKTVATMIRQTQLIPALYMLLTMVACNCKNIDISTPNDRFVAAMVDASRVLTTNDIYNHLVSLDYGASPLVEWKIEDNDTLLLVATLQGSDWQYAHLEMGQSVTTSSQPENTIWVTIPRELKGRLQSEAVISDSLALNQRLIELLGLRPEGTESVVNLFWIDKNSLLRPSYNTDITTTCGAIAYPNDDTLPEWYKQWFEENIAYSYQSPQEGLNYPFTRLGYTYDWGDGKSKYGLSEFITAPSAKITIVNRVGCWSYYREN